MKPTPKPGTRKPREVNATPEVIERGMLLMASADSSRAVAEMLSRETGLEYSERTVRMWREENAERYAEICLSFARARKDATASAAVRLAEVRHEAIAELVEIARTADKANDRVAALRALREYGDSGDRERRLDDGTATEIQETRDTTSDAQLAADVDAMRRDPKTRAALAGVKP